MNSLDCNVFDIALTMSTANDRWRHRVVPVLNNVISLVGFESESGSLEFGVRHGHGVRLGTVSELVSERCGQVNVQR